MSRRAAAWVLLAGTLSGTVLGCGPLPGSRGAGGAGPDGGISLEVSNRHWRDVVVYVTRGGARTRLGMVTSNSRRDFAISRDFIAGGYTVTLRAEVVGSDEFLRPGPVTVSRGDRILWRLRPVLNQSDLSVRAGGGGGGEGGDAAPGSASGGPSLPMPRP
jgi:hypothetical protein